MRPLSTKIENLYSWGQYATKSDNNVLGLMFPMASTGTPHNTTMEFVEIVLIAFYPFNPFKPFSNLYSQKGFGGGPLQFRAITLKHLKRRVLYLANFDFRPDESLWWLSRQQHQIRWISNTLRINNVWVPIKASNVYQSTHPPTTLHWMLAKGVTNNGDLESSICIPVACLSFW